MIDYLSVEQILRIHGLQIERFGGARGVRERGALEAAVARPQMTFGGDDLYPDLAAKAAALMHSLIQNHPFVDGNKRVGAMAAELFLVANGQELDASDDELEATTFAVARGELAAEALAIWVRQRLAALEP
ncbi:MAG: type II toxin-antitoxin system death-on-curing family toxin [Candidatus Binatia bacterium]